jgi:hypothetical protein
VIFTACPKCERTDFPSRAARDSHVYRCKKNSKSFSPKSIRAEPVSQINEHILHPYSDEWDCAACLHRFSSLQSAEEHYKTRHIDKVPYATNQQERIQVEKPVNIQHLLNELANQRAQELSQARFAPRDGVVQQNLVVFEPEPSPQAPIVESDSREKEQESERPQSTAVYNFLKNLFRGKGKMQVAKEPLNQIFMANRGVGVDGLTVAWNPKPNYCKNDKVWLYDIEVQQHVELGHTVVRQG